MHRFNLNSQDQQTQIDSIKCIIGGRAKLAFIFIDANSANPMHGFTQKDSVITYNVLWCEHPPSGCNGRGQAMGMAVHALSFAVRVANARPLPAVDWLQPIGS